jgi:hypothetical protein
VLDMQKLMLGELEKAIADTGHTPVLKANFSNCGKVYAMRGLRSACVFCYDFQRDYFHLQVADERGSYGTGTRCPCGGGMFRYQDGAKVERFLHAAKDLLAKAAPREDAND